MLLITLLACYDFEGDRGTLGFVTDIHLDSGVKWNPDYAVVGGSVPTVAAVQRVGAEEDEPTPEVWGDVGFEVASVQGTELSFYGPELGCGLVHYEGELEDEFTMCFEEAASMELFDPFTPGVALEAVALAAPARLHVRVLDFDGEPLGFVVGELVVEGDGQLEGSEVQLRRPGEVEVSLAGLSTSVVVLDDEPARWQTEVLYEDEDQRIEHTYAWTLDGVPVLGVEPG